mmetsp:Transcript_87297/g.250156  ORF Transcript_87297/g.250156 Transcript_87297/m.250156 type:complete len:214 (-) Transcript_87297:19-660(-)
MHRIAIHEIQLLAEGCAPDVVTDQHVSCPDVAMRIQCNSEERDVGDADLEPIFPQGGHLPDLGSDLHLVVYVQDAAVGVEVDVVEEQMHGPSREQSLLDELRPAFIVRFCFAHDIVNPSQHPTAPGRAPLTPSFMAVTDLADLPRAYSRGTDFLGAETVFSTLVARQRQRTDEGIHVVRAFHATHKRADGAAATRSRGQEKWGHGQLAALPVK